MATHSARSSSEAHAKRYMSLYPDLISHATWLSKYRSHVPNVGGTWEDSSGASEVWPNLIRGWQPILAPVLQLSDLCL